ncbi:hypothetical protein ROHU_033030 [Labeo rohita]|uniref:Uncharacterized protein n=1 Tax=Labeo rohita TaxID=84645 RepID=A0A498LCR8_LABRO|nr:hypothetical protein ROHU_033030 [Labeo rohita]
MAAGGFEDTSVQPYHFEPESDPERDDAPKKFGNYGLDRTYLNGALSVFPRSGSAGSVMYYVTKNSHFTTGNVSFMDFLKPFHQPRMPLKGKMDIMVPDCSCESTNFTILPGKPVILITINDGSCTKDCVEGNGLAQYLCIFRYYAD